jgi:hypothetical protein
MMISVRPLKCEILRPDLVPVSDSGVRFMGPISHDFACRCVPVACYHYSHIFSCVAMSSPSVPIFPSYRAAQALFANKTVRSVPLEVLSDPFVHDICLGTSSLNSWLDLRSILKREWADKPPAVLPWAITQLDLVTKILPDKGQESWRKLWSESLPYYRIGGGTSPKFVGVIHEFMAASLLFKRPIPLDCPFVERPISRAAELLALSMLPSIGGQESLPIECIPVIRQGLIEALFSLPAIDGITSGIFRARPLDNDYYFLAGHPSVRPGSLIPAELSKSLATVAWALDNATAIYMKKLAGTGALFFKSAQSASIFSSRLEAWPSGPSAMARTHGLMARFPGGPLRPGPSVEPLCFDDLVFTSASMSAMSDMFKEQKSNPSVSLMQWLNRQGDHVSSQGTVRNLLESESNSPFLFDFVKNLASVIGGSNFPSGDQSTLAHLVMEVEPFPNAMRGLLEAIGPQACLALDGQGRTSRDVAQETLSRYFESDVVRTNMDQLDQAILSYSANSHSPSPENSSGDISRRHRRI